MPAFDKAETVFHVLPERRAFNVAREWRTFGNPWTLMSVMLKATPGEAIPGSFLPGM